MRQLHGDMITTTISSGLHRLPGYDTAKVTASLEYKRRIFCEIYANDKTNASMNGTPPFLTRQFCQLIPCLDLPTEALYFPPAQLSQAISQLDENGWSRSTDSYHYTTLLRAKVRHTSVREEILELALGINVDVSEARIKYFPTFFKLVIQGLTKSSDLHLRSQGLYDSLPQILHYYDGPTPKNSTGSLLYDQAYLYLQYLQNKFLIDRLATARGLPNEQGLLETSMNILDTSLMFWMKRDQLMEFSFNFDWIVRTENQYANQC